MYGLVGLSQHLNAIFISMAATSILNILSLQLLVFYVYLLPNQDMAIMAVISHATVTILLAGFAVKLQRLYAIFRWMSYLFPGRYSLQIIMVTQFTVMPLGS